MSRVGIKEEIRSISYVKANAAEIVGQVNESQRPVYITQNGEAKAVMLDIESYEKLKAAVGLLKLLCQGEHDIAEGKYLTQEEFFAAMDHKLGINK